MQLNCKAAKKNILFMSEFWEDSFQSNKEMWGWKPADSALITLELFKKYNLHHILIPGFGYERNAKVFIEAGFNVSGIEIAGTAIDLAKQQFGVDIKLYHGSVDLMPFDQTLYDGIFCYALLHLLNTEQRSKFIADCYSQLEPDGYMVFISLSNLDSRFGQGNEIYKDTFATRHGINLFFYDATSIESEFSNYGLIEAEVLNEPLKDSGGKPSQKFWYIVCKKAS
jgi:SAM-dependent methyltransferase